MATRGNVLVTDGDSHVYLYQHWDADDLPGKVRDALARDERWTDGQYLARIIFAQMIGEDTAGTTGYGITSVVWDGESRIVIVDVDRQEVRINGHTWTFTEYVKAPTEDLDFAAALPA